MKESEIMKKLKCGKCHSSSHIRKAIFDGEPIYFCARCSGDTPEFFEKCRKAGIEVSYC